MNSLKAIAGLLLIIGYSSAQADEGWHITLHTVSHHFSERENGKQWKEENLGLGIRREFSGDMSLQTGFYRNSLDKWSTYAIGEYTPIAMGNLHTGLYAGVRTNYSKPVLPAAGALIRWQGESYSVTLRAAPKICGSCSAFVGLELGWRL